MKKILFVNFHPVDSQVVRFAAKALEKKGNRIKFLFSEKEGIISEILTRDGFDITQIGEIKPGLLKRLLSSILLELNLAYQVHKFKPNLIFSASSIYTGLVSKLFRIPLICWADTETAIVNLKTSLPFISSLLVPESFYEKIDSDKKEIRYNGYKELAYLHPNWFKKDSSLLDKLNLQKVDKIILMRFSALRSMHDIGLKSVGDNKSVLLSYVKQLEKYARVFISMTENDLGEEFIKYRLDIHPSDYIQLLAHCSLYIGEGTTTASEAGVLGVPWIALRPHALGYLNDQENNYDLGFRTDDINEAFITALKWIQQDDLLKKWKKKKDRLFNDKIDVSAFLIWFIENYPQSHKIMKENPEYQERFK